MLEPLHQIKSYFEGPIYKKNLVDIATLNINRIPIKKVKEITTSLSALKVLSIVPRSYCKSCYVYTFLFTRADKNHRTPVATTFTFPNLTSLSNCVINCSSKIVLPRTRFDFFSGPRLSISAHSVTTSRGSKSVRTSPLRLTILGIP